MTQNNGTTVRRPPPSPCIGVCELDETIGLCLGCGRTMAEISNWLRFDDAAREAVWRELPGRLERLKP